MTPHNRTALLPAAAAAAAASVLFVLDAFGPCRLPPELTIDELMDMARTSVNVAGNCLATVIIARWEGVFGSEAPPAVVMDAVAR